MAQTERTTDAQHWTGPQMKGLLELAAGPAAKRLALIQAARDGGALLRLLDELGQAADYGRGFLAALRSEHSSAEVLRVLKERAKTFLETAPTEQHRTAALLGYHLAVAAAYARHGACLSSQRIEERWGLYEDLSSAVEDPALARIFGAAVERLSASNPEIR